MNPSLLAHGDIPCVAEVMGISLVGTALMFGRVYWHTLRLKVGFWLIARHLRHSDSCTCQLCRYTPFVAL